MFEARLIAGFLFVNNLFDFQPLTNIFTKKNFFCETYYNS